MTESPGDIVVRPRVVWTGVAISLLGMIGTALVLVSSQLGWGWALLGAAVIAVGFAVSWRGGILGDVHGGGALQKEVRAVTDADVHPGVSPAQEIDDDPTQRDARATNRRTREVLRRAPKVVRHDRPRRVAAQVLVLMAIWLILSPWELGHELETGAAAAILRQFIAAGIITLSALWLHQVGPNRLVSGLVTVVGVLLVLAGVFIDIQGPVFAVNQIITGSLVIVAAIVSNVPSPWARDQEKEA